MEILLEQVLNGVAIGSLYGLMTLGLTLVYGILRILHIAHAAVYTAGAYLGLWTFQWSGSLLLGAIVAMAGCSALGVGIERLVYFPLLRYPPFVPLIASIAVLLGTEEVCRLLFGPYILAFPAKVPLPSISLGNLVVSAPLLAVYIVTAAILLALWYIVARTRLGLAMRAVAQSRPMADALGIDTHRIITITFVLGSSIAALAGILVGIYYNQVYPTMGAVPAYKTLAIIVVGGLGNIQGSVIASLLVGMAETLLIGFANIPLPRDALAFMAMIAVLLWRAEGLFRSR
jgi:branched-chain amino acid transport system permease protein